MRRVYRFIKWYLALRRTDPPEWPWRFSRRLALAIAWRWSSDKAAFVRAGGGPG